MKVSRARVDACMSTCVLFTAAEWGLWFGMCCCPIGGVRAYPAWLLLSLLLWLLLLSLLLLWLLLLWLWLLLLLLLLLPLLLTTMIYSRCWGTGPRSQQGKAVVVVVVCLFF